MSTRTVEQIDSWNTVPFSGGYSGLADLADSGFSGAVVAGPTRLFMLNGKVVGVLDGSIEDFEDGGGTAREAPHPGLPLLAVMQERSDEVRAKYYTEETSISEVNQTLESGGFTGYVELSENVLSGDYYQIYHQGRSMSVAWVGNSDQLLTEDEAFEQADGEVGIYEVRPVDIEIIEIPTPVTDADESEDTAETAETTPATPSDAGEVPDGTDSTPSNENPSEKVDSAPRTTGTDPVAKTGGETAGRQTGESAGQRTERTDPDEDTSGRSVDTAADATGPAETDASDAPEPVESEPDGSARGEVHTPDGAEQRREPDPSQRREPNPSKRREPDASQPQDSAGSSEVTPSGDDGTATEQPGRSRSAEAIEQTGERRQPDPGHQSDDAGDVTAAPHDPSATGATDLETRSIPSLDPAHSETASKSSSAVDRFADDPVEPSAQSSSPAESRNSGSSEGRQEPERRQATAESRSRQSQPETEPRQSQGGAGGEPPEQSHPGAPANQRSGRDDRSEPVDREPAEETQNTAAASPERVEELETALEESEAERERLSSELDSLADERDDLQQELESARSEIERLEQRIEELASEDDDDTIEAETRLSKREAIDQTNLFVRYSTKGDATLEAVHSGNAEQSAVDDNLRLEFHTQFDAETAAVGNEPFETFLSESIQYRFVDWLVRNLLYEIRDTGNPEAMKELYNALPKIDRAELNGAISVEYTEDGEQHRAQEQFDVVVRDRMGNPLIVANINDSRDPATDDMMTDLITRAERVGSSSESLAGAFLVTESFFEPPALETAEEATSSGLLSRDKRKSFVNLTRKDGYHLCLVEARNQEFHLAVPEL